MSEYRRLISYIYEYEGKEKGKNVGFVKLEARNGQCRLNVNVKRMYVGGNAIGVYLLSKKGEHVLLGNMFVRNGGGEFRTTVDAKNVEGSGTGLDGYYGLTVHDVKNAWRSYTTMWEDSGAAEGMEEPGELEALGELGKPGELEAQEELGNPEELGKTAESTDCLRESDASVGPMAQDILPGCEERPHICAVSSVVQEIEAEITRSAELHSEEEWADGGEETAGRNAECAGPHEGNCGEKRNFASEKGLQAAEENPPAEQIMVSPELENPEVLQYLRETENTEANPEQLWQELRKAYPKIQPFDYDGGSEVLTIGPQDIGKLPRENWIYGNNSFLLHGYYNFRYLILVRLDKSDGSVRYLLGIPGHYYSSEKYMATMFGFPNFVLSKKQPLNDGRFGYWYTDIKMR